MRSRSLPKLQPIHHDWHSRSGVNLHLAHMVMLDTFVLRSIGDAGCPDGISQQIHLSEVGEKQHIQQAVI